jgi:WD40 repeat protein
MIFSLITLLLLINSLVSFKHFPTNRKSISNGESIVHIWNFTNGQLKFSLDGHTSKPVVSLAALDGSLLASGSTDSTIKVWNVETGELKFTLTDCDTCQALGYFLLVKLDDNLLASASDQGITIWNTTNGSKKFSLTNKIVLDMIKFAETYLTASTIDSKGVSSTSI